MREDPLSWYQIAKIKRMTIKQLIDIVKPPYTWNIYIHDSWIEIEIILKRLDKCWALQKPILYEFMHEMSYSDYKINRLIDIEIRWLKSELIENIRYERKNK